ncbi:MAG: FAD-dependent oxidoreductase [Casimicrobiaceae bacterium]|nr:FAD-dependent oxidoreductase [Casimicrobiaceae bacterium]MDW8312523.1 FAD-dependent oxidoreductase [Burkholderiales bacterium]
MGRTLALVGAGLAHLEIVRRLATQPLHDVDVVLFSPHPSSLYADMVPGVIAGHLSAAQARINLWALCQRARVRFFETAVTRLDPHKRHLFTADGEHYHYEVVSLSVGGAASAITVEPGAYVVPARPTLPLLQAIEAREKIAHSQFLTTVVGSGPAAVQIALALAYRWRAAARPITLISDRPLLGFRSAAVSRRLRQALRRLNVELIEGVGVVAATPTHLQLSDGSRQGSHFTILATQYAPPPLLSSSGLTLAPDGRLLVNAALRSASAHNVFAAGECANVAGAGAVESARAAARQGAILWASLTAYFRQRPLPRRTPTHRAVSLLALGERRALLRAGPLAVDGGWLWVAKNRLDLRHVRRYQL